MPTTARSNDMRQLGIAVVILVILALLVLSLYAVCGYNEGTLSCLRDVAIIVLVLETFVVTLLMALIVLIFGRLLKTIEDQVLPILHSAKNTADTVQGTTKFVSDTLVAPLIGIASFGSAIKGTMGALFNRRQRRK
jgi:hypothetical protein